MKTFSRILLALFYVVAGLNHFLMPDWYMKIMPPYLPWPYALVLLSGAAEVFLGVLAFFPSVAPLAGWGLAALLLAVFPANVYMALHTENYPALASWIPWARLPFQGLFIVWALWSTDALTILRRERSEKLNLSGSRS